VAFALGAKKIKANCLNTILKDFDRISFQRDFHHLSKQAYIELEEYLPRRIKR